MEKSTSKPIYGRPKEIGPNKGFCQKNIAIPNSLKEVMKEFSNLARKKMISQHNYHRARSDSYIIRRLIIYWTLKNTINTKIRILIQDFINDEDEKIKNIGKDNDGD